MLKCCVRRCGARKLKGGISFHRIPKDPRVRRLWLRHMKRPNWIPPETARICGWHFLGGSKIPTRFKWNQKKLAKNARLCHGGSNAITPPNSSLPISTDDENTPPMRNGPTCSQLVSPLPISTDDENTPPMRNGPTCSQLVMAENVALLQNEVQTLKAKNDALREENGALRQDNAVILVQHHMTASHNKLLQQEVERLRQEVMLLKDRHRFAGIANNEKMVYTLTGLPSCAAFNALVGLMRTFPVRVYQGWTPASLTLEDQLLICLTKLGRNSHVDDLAFHFGVSRTAISNCVISIAHYLAYVLYTKGIAENLPSYAKVREAMSGHSCPYQIWDCTEAYMESCRSSLSSHRSTYSAYKGNATLKCLVSISPNGVILFVSDFYGGCISDKEIVQKSGILRHLSCGDVIYADKGFLVQDILPPGVVINLPSFLDTHSHQLTHDQVVYSSRLSSIRIHVERVIQRIKAYTILNLISHHYRPHATAFLKCIAGLVNMQKPVVSNIGVFQA